MYNCLCQNILKLPIYIATNEGNSRKEMWHYANNEIGVAAQSWLRVQVELILW